ncbi:hypothetical protein EFK50_01085 [Nocardioides marmoriginsengisoli]|uniref:Uncharacterized protein n=1 Tax=Nocardioides marmoriginsengisoli TaxID=661483 RepID=A0A3N0CS71_9ACTN|nr:hypothetical protein [Nocardioides marmoriginsengisoli]RNL66250.1 hypothetical protein EFK50_01085 [Nocardioides marmoriginsengisoli]
MAGAEETLVLTDGSVQDRVRAALQPLGLGSGELLIEPAEVYPGQELAIDLTATTPAALNDLISQVRTILRRDVGITDAPTATELESHGISAAS